MALLIKGWCNDEFERELGTYEWHIGESVPNLARVVEFKADGDELNLFIQAMAISHSGRFVGNLFGHNVVVFKATVRSFFVNEVTE